MQHLAKVIPALIALLFLVMGVSFVFDPVAGAAQVGVTPLGADGLNTIRNSVAAGDLAGRGCVADRCGSADAGDCQRSTDWFCGGWITRSGDPDCVHI
jgi:hypothetical protein